MPITYTHIQPATATLLKHVAPDVFDHEISEYHLRHYLTSRERVLIVARDGPLVVGQCRGLIIHHPDQAPELCIENLGVSPDWQRRGIAGELMRQLKTAAKGFGCADFYVLTEAENQDARAFYEAQGWPETPCLMFDGSLAE